MKAERLKILEQFFAENPNDPFTIYGLALEYLDLNPAKASALFENLLTNFENYLPTYYQAASHFATQHQSVKALEIATKGIEKAMAVRELKTASELRNLMELIDDGN